MEQDSALVARVLAGDRAAFGALMARHRAWLYRYIRRHVAGAEDADDLLQETFASAWRALARYDPARPLEIWLRRIALNKCRDLGRRRAVRRAVFAIAPFLDLEAQTPSAEPGAETSLIADQALRQLHEAIAALPAPLREALVLTALEGFSHRDAALVLQTNAKAIENRVARARARLAAALEREQVRDLTAG